MPTALIIAAGSRGDTEPFLSLSLSLLSSQRFQSVHICLQRDYVHLLPSHPNLIPHPMPFDLDKIYALFAPLFFKDLLLSLLHRRPPHILPVQNAALALFIKKAVFAHLPILHALATQIAPDIIIGGILTAVAAHTIAQHLSVPVANFYFWPIVRTHVYPYLLADVTTAHRAADAIVALRPSNNPLRSLHDLDLTTEQQRVNLTSYHTLEHGFHLPGLSDLNTFRAKLSLAPLTPAHLTAIFAATLPGVHAVNAYPKQLVPLQPHWPASVHSVPALADDYLPPGWDPAFHCPNLLKYVSSSTEKPFCVSFGSMRLLDHKRAATRAIFSALKKLGMQRVILFSGDMRLGANRLSPLHGADRDLKRWARNHVFETSEPVQYAWLLPYCRGLLCHGGAGTVAAALRAGIPLAIAPVVCDQFFWAQLLRNVGRAGMVQGDLRAANEGDFLEALGFAMRAEVVEYGREMRKSLVVGGRGADIAAELMSRLAK